MEGDGTTKSPGQGTAGDGPLGLQDKELHLWVTYPETKRAKTKRRGKASKSGGNKRKLWAVVIVESLRQEDAFTYEVTLKRINKKDERIIKVLVKNDPADQSEEATVFGITSPRDERLDALEKQLSMWAAMRVYEAIAETWPCELACAK